MKDKILNEVEFELLKEFQKHLPGAIIAGGAVRDMHFGLPFSDVDIFYDNSSLSIAYIYDEVIPRIFDYTLKDKFWRVMNSAFQRSDTIYGEDTRDVVELEKYKGTRYQFIAVPGDPVRHVHKFDLNCCKIFYDGEKIHQTGDFKDFWKTRELNVSENYKKSKYMGAGRLDKRVDKILFRYKKQFDIKISAFLEAFLEEQKKNREEMNKKHDARFMKVKSMIEADQAMANALQQIDNAAIGTVPVGVQHYSWNGVSVVSTTTTQGTLYSTGNPFGPLASAQGTQGINMNTPFIEGGTSSLWSDDPIWENEPVPEPTEPA